MIIYMAINKINNKKYIGKTSKSLEQRKLDHEKNSKKGSKLLFHRAIRKYGKENFIWNIICICKNDNELNNKEIEMIKTYNTIGNGYNISTGGTGGDNLTFNPNKEKICKKISESLKGIIRGPQSENHKMKNRNSHLGKKDSDEVKKKKSIAHAKNWKLTSPEGLAITEFEISLKHFCKQNNLSSKLLRNYTGKKVPFDKRIKQKNTIGWRLDEV